MRLVLYGEMTITDIQKQFANAYPFLKIEFFKNGSSKQQIYPGSMQLAHSLKLKDASFSGKAAGELFVDDVMKVSDLEKIFMDRFGLTAQVFRRSGNIWLETSITNGWTLKQQNDHGREITSGKEPKDKTEDYDLNRDVD
jgi:hypothetical protein